MLASVDRCDEASCYFIDKPRMLLSLGLDCSLTIRCYLFSRLGKREGVVLWELKTNDLKGAKCTTV